MVKHERPEKGMVDGLYKVPWAPQVTERGSAHVACGPKSQPHWHLHHNTTAGASKTEASYFLSSAWPSSTVKSRRNSLLGVFLRAWLGALILGQCDGHAFGSWFAVCVHIGNSPEYRSRCVLQILMQCDVPILSDLHRQTVFCRGTAILVQRLPHPASREYP